MAEELVEDPVVEAQEPEPEIEIIDDTPENEKQPPGKPLPENLDEQTASVRRSINRLTAQRSEALRQLGESKREHEAAVQFAKDALARLKYETDERVKAQNAWKVEAAARREAEIRSSRSDYVAARTAEDPGKEADVSAQMARLAAEKGQIEQWSPVIPQLPVIPDRQPPQQQAQPSQEPTETDLAWLEKNEWFVDQSNAAMVAYTVALENELESQGFKRGTKACYDALDENIRHKFPEKFSEKPAAAPVKKQTSPVVGATRTTPNGTRNGDGKIRLTASQAAIAKQLGISYTDYYNNMDPKDRQ